MKIAKRLWHVVRVLCCMVHKNISKHKFMLSLNLHLLLERGRILGRSIGDLLAFHNRRHHGCDGDVGFSCGGRGNAPLRVTGGRKRRDARRDRAPNIVEAFEARNSDVFGYIDADPRVRQVRVTDSPFPVSGAEEGGSQVDREAEEFIRRFYECLRLQQDQASSGLES